MASAKNRRARSSPGANPPASDSRRRGVTARQEAPLEVVDPRWLVKAVSAAVAAAVVLGYLSICLLVWQGGWQFLLHPSRKIDRVPSERFDEIRFDAATTGTPRLSGWWIPAETPANAPTVLYLHDGSGSLSASVPELDLLHAAGVNLFAIDYRGFGESDAIHPTQSRMNEDAEAALDYLLNTRHLPASSLVPYGKGLGAVLAVELADLHPDVPAFILDTPDANVFARVTSTKESYLLPMSLLVQERFDLRSALHESHRPKLLLADNPFGADSARVGENQAVFRAAPDPKTIVTFARRDSEKAYEEAIRRFLDEYLPHS